MTAGMPAGSVTDDTDQAVIVGRLLVESGGPDRPLRLAEELLEWERGMKAKGSLDLLGPSTKAALEAVSPRRAARGGGPVGATNGAAMRITPVGVAFPVRPLERFLDQVAAACQVTHDTTIGIAGAAAVAAAVSRGVDGGGLDGRLRRGDHGGRRPAPSAATGWPAPTSRPDRLGRGPGPRPARGRRPLDRDQRPRSAPASPARSRCPPPSPCWPWPTATRGAPACLAANLGGDCDTIGAIAGAIAGAVSGASRPARRRASPPSARVNDLDLEPLARPSSRCGPPR